MDVEAILAAVTGLLSLIGVAIAAFKVKRSGRDTERLKQTEENHAQSKKAHEAIRDYFDRPSDDRRASLLDAARKDSSNE